MGAIIEDFNGNLITTITDDKGDPWFVAKEVCAVLGIAGDAGQATRYLDEDEKQTLINTQGLTSSRNPNVVIISEPGLYKLIGKSRKPEAKAFNRWVCHDVLPAIRKTGDARSNRKNEFLFVVKTIRYAWVLKKVRFETVPQTV